MKNFRPTYLLAAIGIIALTSGCFDLNDPNQSQYGGYNSGYNNGYGNNYPPYGSGSSYQDRRERERLERERDRLEDERERLEKERNRRPTYRPPPPPPPAPERCPSGYSPSEQKCSNEERRRGCKDMRLPGGLGCVRR
jgi:hypothetical protein